MSKEREAFTLKLEKHFIFLEPENDDGISSGETVVPVDTVLEVATTHYQPLLDALKLEAQIHSGEAKTANATLNEIYQLCSGAKGEKANWNGAQPVRELLDAKDAEIATWKVVTAQEMNIANKLREENTSLKALLEQAREIDRLALVIESSVRWQEKKDSENYKAVNSLLINNAKTLAAINAASQNSQSFNGNQTCETSSDTTGEK